MPSCYICDKGMDEVHLDARDMKPRPCSECEHIVNELLLGYGLGDKEKQEPLDIDLAYIESELIEYDEEISAGLTGVDHAEC